MPTSSAPLGSLVHPHHMEVQEFASYALIIDARSATAFEEDHIPGAIHVPVDPGGRDNSAVSGTVGASLPPALAVHLQLLGPDERVLVYCDRGGLDSLVWARLLRSAGFEVDVLGGGWINYRRWVSAGLDLLPRLLTFRRLTSSSSSGLQLVLEALSQRGEQVLDLSTLADRDQADGTTLSRASHPSQAALETALLDAMRRFEAQRPVWARDDLGISGRLTLPAALRDALSRSDAIPLVLASQSTEAVAAASAALSERAGPA
jgi:tRNA 2-selenouridine synthase